MKLSQIHWCVPVHGAMWAGKALVLMLAVMGFAAVSYVQGWGAIMPYILIVGGASFVLGSAMHWLRHVAQKRHDEEFFKELDRVTLLHEAEQAQLEDPDDTYRG